MGSSLDRLLAEDLRQQQGPSEPSALDSLLATEPSAPGDFALDSLAGVGPDTTSLAPRDNGEYPLYEAPPIEVVAKPIPATPPRTEPNRFVESLKAGLRGTPLGSIAAIAGIPFRTSFGRGVRGGLEGQNVETTGAFVETVGDLIESERISRAGRSLEEIGKARGQPFEPEAKSWREALQTPSNLPEYVGSEAGRAVASSLPSIAGGFAGGVLGGMTGPAAPVAVPVGTALGAGAPAYVMNTGDVAQELEALGVTDPKARAIAALEIGAAITAFDVIPTARIAGKLYRTALRKKIAEEAVKRGLIPAIAREAATNFALEGVTEGIQEGIQYGATRAVADQPMSGMEALERSAGP
jgi:hypothetical protein